MTKTEKTWAWIAAGGAAVVGAILLWPKEAKAQTPSGPAPTKAHIDYVSSFSSPVFNGKIGDTLTIALPVIAASLKWHIEGAEQLYTAKEIPEGALLTATHKGAGTIWVSKVNQQNQGVEPAMAVNISIS